VIEPVHWAAPVHTPVVTMAAQPGDCDCIGYGNVVESAGCIAAVYRTHVRTPALLVSGQVWAREGEF
jgi:hypothetical protein